MAIVAPLRQCICTLNTAIVNLVAGAANMYI